MGRYQTIDIPMRDGESIAVRCLGEGPPCVLLHGFAMDSRYWLPFAWMLRRKYRFILPDLRGFGLSHDVSLNQACAVSNFAHDLEDLLDHLKLDRVALGGISMGAFVALRYNELYGFKRITRYLHIDQGPKILNSPEWSYGIFGDAQAGRLGGLEALLEEAHQYSASIPYRDLPKAFRQRIWREFGLFTEMSMGSPIRQKLAKRGMSIETIGTSVLPMRNWSIYLVILQAYLEQNYDLRPSLSSITVPVTVMIGMLSKMYPPAGQMKVVEAIPTARAVRFEKSGHSLIWDEARKFQRELNVFLKA